MALRSSSNVVECHAAAGAVINKSLSLDQASKLCLSLVLDHHARQWQDMHLQSCQQHISFWTCESSALSWYQHRHGMMKLFFIMVLRHGWLAIYCERAGVGMKGPHDAVMKTASRPFNSAHLLGISQHAQEPHVRQWQHPKKPVGAGFHQAGCASVMAGVQSLGPDLQHSGTP